MRIPLEPLGFTSISNRYLLQGATMLTVNYVDRDHLLVTFAVAKLLKRLPDCPPDDDDRIVKAVLLELPAGKEIAQTEWRFHDLGQYLWDLGGGVFILRQRDTLTTFQPLEELAHGDAFLQQPFLKFDRRIDAIIISANHDLLTVETTKKASPKQDPVASSQPTGSTPPAKHAGLQRRDPAEARPPDLNPVEISFLRLVRQHAGSNLGDGGRPDKIVAAIDGRLRAQKAVIVPLTSEGFLETKDTTRDGVLFDFVTFSGRIIELGDFATSCPPKPTFVSPSEFVAFGCRGSEDAVDLAGFNLGGDLIWQINFNDVHAYPSFVSAAPAGRFAMSRTLTLSNIFGNEAPSASQLTGQEVRVLQMYNGKQLLKVMTSPIQPAGQNFAFSPDGMDLAIIHDNATVRGTDTLHDTAVEIYKLPPISSKDQREISAEAGMMPEHTDSPIRFSLSEIRDGLAQNARKAESDVSSGVGGFGSIPASGPAAVCAGLVEKQANACQVTPQTKQPNGPAVLEQQSPRKPPTLYEPAPANDPATSAVPKPQL